MSMTLLMLFVFAAWSGRCLGYGFQVATSYCVTKLSLYPKSSYLSCGHSPPKMTFDTRFNLIYFWVMSFSTNLFLRRIGTFCVLSQMSIQEIFFKKDTDNLKIMKHSDHLNIRNTYYVVSGFQDRVTRRQNNSMQLKCI